MAVRNDFAYFVNKHFKNYVSLEKNAFQRKSHCHLIMVTKLIYYE